jgi:hypothetical protein
MAYDETYMQQHDAFIWQNVSIRVLMAASWHSRLAVIVTKMMQR